MNLRSVTRDYNQQFSQLGRSLLHARFPNDFEVYMMALELTDADGNTIDYFSFPVMPQSIQKTELKRTNIKKTSSGVTVLSSATFTPEEITIKGNFGKSFKIIVGKEPHPKGVAFSIPSGKMNLLGKKAIKTPDFSIGVKNGYGATKILQSIINKSTAVGNDGRPFRLYFYNMALGESYLVAASPTGLQLSMSEDKNMIWEYTLNLTTIAPLSLSFFDNSKTSLTRLLSTSLIQGGLNKLGSNIAKTIRF
jgi:hypothetical protein